MSGFFRGPSLTTHALALAIILAVIVPMLRDWLGSTSMALLLGTGLAFVYTVTALLWASRGLSHRNSDDTLPATKDEKKRG